MPDNRHTLAVKRYHDTHDQSLGGGVEVRSHARKTNSRRRSRAADHRHIQGHRPIVRKLEPLRWIGTQRLLSS